MICAECGSKCDSIESCPHCRCCEDCCECDEAVFSRDELGIDPEEDYDVYER